MGVNICLGAISLQNTETVEFQKRHSDIGACRNHGPVAEHAHGGSAGESGGQGAASAMLHRGVLGEPPRADDAQCANLRRYAYHLAYSTARVSRMTVTLIWPG